MAPRATGASELARARHRLAPRAAGADRGDRTRAGGARLARASSGVRSPAVDAADLTAVHPQSYVDTIERLAADGGGHLDADTLVSVGSYEAALHAAGGAVALVDLLLDERRDGRFSAHRPPGHHALPSRAMGFCLFNNVAVAATHAVRARGLERVLIVDWDVHHGNGTNDIFHATDEVLFVSIHQSPLYPGTGPRDRRRQRRRPRLHRQPAGLGRGRRRVYRSLVDHVVVPLARAYRAAAGAGLGRLRRPPRRPARDVRVTEDGLCGDGALDAAVLRRARGAARGGARGRLRARGAGAVGRRDDGGAWGALRLGLALNRDSGSEVAIAARGGRRARAARRVVGAGLARFAGVSGASSGLRGPSTEVGRKTPDIDAFHVPPPRFPARLDVEGAIYERFASSLRAWASTRRVSRPVAPLAAATSGLRRPWEPSDVERVWRGWT